MDPTTHSVTMEKIVSLCKRRGIIFQNSEIYGGLGSVWDYGPLGVELKRNVKDAWWRSMVQQRGNVVGLDSAILMHPMVWEASGHLSNFADPFVSCTICSRNYRADQIWDAVWESKWWQSLLSTMAGENIASGLLAWAKGQGKKLAPNLRLVLQTDVTLSLLSDLHSAFDGVDDNFKNFVRIISSNPNRLGQVPCPVCGGEVSDPEAANLMMKTFLGPVQATADIVYLRPETAQGIFVNFENVLNSTRKRLPFGIAQIGKSFRNEITPGNFTFRTREFEQMEMEYFVMPEDADSSLQYWVEQRFQWYLDLGIRPENLRLRWHDSDELAHYAKATADVEYLFPMGWSELEGIANRTDFDLLQHSKTSGKSLTVFDEEAKQHVTPYVIEPSGGVDRATLAFLVDSYREEEVRGETRVLLKLHKDLCPVQVAVLPLSRNQRLLPFSQQVFDTVRTDFRAQYDDAQSIGRRYRRQDEIGTPLCVTLDFDSLDDNAVTIRDRDTMSQSRVPIERLGESVRQALATL